MGHRDTLLCNTTYLNTTTAPFSPTRMRPPLSKRLRSSSLIAKYRPHKLCFKTYGLQWLDRTFTLRNGSVVNVRRSESTVLAMDRSPADGFFSCFAHPSD